MFYHSLLIYWALAPDLVLAWVTHIRCVEWQRVLAGVGRRRDARHSDDSDAPARVNKLVSSEEMYWPCECLHWGIGLVCVLVTRYWCDSFSYWDWDDSTNCTKSPVIAVERQSLQCSSSGTDFQPTVEWELMMALTTPTPEKEGKARKGWHSSQHSLFCFINPPCTVPDNCQLFSAKTKYQKKI